MTNERYDIVLMEKSIDDGFSDKNIEEIISLLEDREDFIPYMIEIETSFLFGFIKKEVINLTTDIFTELKKHITALISNTNDSPILRGGVFFEDKMASICIIKESWVY